MRKVLSTIAACLAVIMILSLAACAKKADTDPTGATEATKATETTAATTAQTTAPTQNAGNAAASSGDNNPSGSSDTADTDTDWYHSDETQRSMAQQKVLQMAKELYGEGDWRIESTEKATDSVGNPYWYVGVVNYSKSQSPTYYFHCDPEAYCYPDYYNPSDDGDNDTSFAGISAPDAGAKALETIGDGNWNLDSCIQGEYEGIEAWVITLSNSDEGITRVAFVGRDFCYFK